MSTEGLKPLIALAAERALSRAEAQTAFEILFEGAATPAQVGGFLMALRTNLPPPPLSCGRNATPLSPRPARWTLSAPAGMARAR